MSVAKPKRSYTFEQSEKINITQGTNQKRETHRDGVKGE